MSPELQPEAPSPYRQIADHYRRLITSGELRVGDRLPPVAEIAADWKVAVRTAHKAVRQLQAEQLVASSRPRGTVVTARTAHSSADRTDSVRSTGRIYPPDERARIVAAEVVKAPVHVSDALSVDAGASVIRRDRVTYKSDTPITFSTSWLPVELGKDAPRLMEAERIPEGTLGYVEAATGRAVADVREYFGGGPAPDDVAEQLGLTPSAPVLLKWTWFLEADGSVIEYGESVTIAGYRVTPRSR